MIDAAGGSSNQAAIAAETPAGRDNFCIGYLKAYRAGMFEKWN